MRAKWREFAEFVGLEVAATVALSAAHVDDFHDMTFANDFW
jgi:hypothetical protein